MDAHDRFHRRSLRDVLVGQGVITEEVADELVQAARETHEPFGSVAVEGGHVTAWDLARLVATHFQMPVLPLAGFRYDRQLGEGIPTATLHQYHLLPVGRFGRVRTFAVVEPPSRDCLDALRDVCGNHVFFFAGEAPEIQRLLHENVKVVDVTQDRGWQSIFDTADRSVLDGIGTNGE